MYDNNVFIKNLSKLIEDKKTENKTQNQIADEIGISTGALSKYLNGNATPKADVLYLLAKYFNVTADYLLGLSDVPTTDKDLQFVCNYTGLSEDTIVFFRYSRYTELSLFIEFLIFELFYDDIENVKLYNKNYFIKQSINSKYIINCIKISNEIEEIEEELNKLHEKIVNTDEDDEEFFEVLNEESITEERLSKAQINLNGNKFYISKKFNEIFDEFLKNKEYEF